MNEPAETSMVVPAAAAASTERIHVGVGVMVLALRLAEYDLSEDSTA